MGRGSRTLLALGLGWLLLSTPSQAADVVTTKKPATCPPGYTFVEEIVQKEITRYVCKYVCEPKKVRRTVYECRDEPFCLAKCSLCSWLHNHIQGCGGCDKCHGRKDGCDACPKCEGPYLRRVLVKREIVEEKPTFRCVVEAVKEVVPVKVYRQVPCVTPPPR